MILLLAIARIVCEFVPAAVPKRSSAVTAVRWYLDATIVVLLVLLLLFTFVVRPFSIPSISMIPTLQIRDVVLVDEFAYHLHPPHFGDLAVFMPPIPSDRLPFVKRVIGIPGDTIRIAHGVVYRDGAALREPYINQAPRYDLDIRNDTIEVGGRPLDPATADIPPRSMWQAPNRIPAGFYLMLGDNRNYSDDSHSWGFAQRGRFIGRAFLVLWPLGRIHILH